MYCLKIANGPLLRSEEIARMVAARDGHPDTMRHLGAIERIEARGIVYSNQDFDVLSAAYSFATQA
jgi:hypothetical protein